MNFAEKNHQLEALRELGRQLLEASRDPDAPPPCSASPASREAAQEAEPRSFPAEDGGTLSPMFTELDSTESHACAM